MIKLLPAFYSASAVLSSVALLVLALVLFLPRTRRFSRRFLYAFAGLALVFMISAVTLSRYCERLESRVQSVSFGASRAEVLALLGSPSEKYEPAIGVGQKPDPNLAVWYYQVRAFPFQYQYRFEFAYDKLISK